LATLGRVIIRRGPAVTSRPTPIRRRLAALPPLLATVALVAACSFGSPPPDQNGSPPTFPSPSGGPSAPGSNGDGATGNAEAAVLATGVPQPWGIAFLPDGTGLVTERKTGRIISLAPPQTTSGLTVAPAAAVHGIDTAGDGGLLGIAVSPHYTTDKTVFVYYSTKTDNRIASLRLGGAPHVIVHGIPHGATDNGGALGFGPDGYLYASTGDAGHAANSQSAKSLAGKILRMTTSGKPAKGKISLVYASGFHDVEGLAWDTAGHLYVVDAGTKTSDNLDVVRSGGNYGWPTAKSGVVRPVQTFPLAQSGCAGVAAIDTAVATACTTGKQLWLVQVTAKADVIGAPANALSNTYGRLRAAAAAPDGSLWIGTSNTDGHGHPGTNDDQILRVVLADEGAGVT
jgi:glucose/arabinose dehydrogenase